MKAIQFDRMHLQTNEASAASAASAVPAAPAPPVGGNFQEQCDICGTVVTSMNESMLMKKYETHVAKFHPELGDGAGSTRSEFAGFANWIEISDDGSRTSVPPVEVDDTDKRSFTCRYGCQTSSGMERRFMNKKTFLEHIVLEHPRVRIVLETPPNEEKRTDGTRHIMTTLNEHGK
jgi:hypothetical protein